MPVFRTTRPLRATATALALALAAVAGPARLDAPADPGAGA
jgi:hypothetical protein